MRWPSSLLLLLVLLVPSAVRAEKAGFLLRAGADTLSLERFTRDGNAIEGEVVFRPIGARFTYHYETANGAARSLSLSANKLASPPDAAPLQVSTVRFAGDSVFVDSRPGGHSAYGTTPGALAYLNPSMAMVEDVVRALLTRPADAMSVPCFLVMGGQTAEVTATRPAPDSLTLVLGGLPLLLHLGPDGRLLGGLIPAQGVVIERVSDTVALMPETPPDYTAPPGAPYTAEEVKLAAPGGFTLAGTLTRPTGAKGPVPAVVTITGSGQEDRDESLPIVRGFRPFRQIADTLARRGIAVLRLDDRGVGGSGGPVASATSRDFANDIRTALAWLRRQPGIDGKRLGLVGHSEGGLIAPMVAADDRQLRGIVLMAGPAYTGRRVLEYQYRRAMEGAYGAGTPQADSAYRAQMIEVDASMANVPWMKFFAEYDPLPTAGRVKTPVLVLQGATDRQVTAEQAPLLAKAFRDGGNRDVTEHTFPDMNHLFLPDPSGDPRGYLALPVRRIPPEVLGTIADWLAARLR